MDTNSPLGPCRSVARSDTHHARIPTVKLRCSVVAPQPRVFIPSRMESAFLLMCLDDGKQVGCCVKEASSREMRMPKSINGR